MSTALLADLGADVIKIESPEGDHYRDIGVPAPDGNGSALFQCANRGKRSIALDLSVPEDRDVLLELAVGADLIVENFRPGVLDHFGLGWTMLRGLNPRLILVSISGFGQVGEGADRPAYDTIIQALSGFMATNGDPAGPPMLAGEAIADVASGFFASWGALAALAQRSRTGRGLRVDVPLLGSLMSMIPTASASWLLSGKVLPRSGNRHPVSAPFGVYGCRTGQFAVAVITQRQFNQMLQAMDRDDLRDDPRFASDRQRRANEECLAEVIETWAAMLDAGEAVARLEAAGVPASVVHDVPAAWTWARSAGFAPAVSLSGWSMPRQPVAFDGHAPGPRRKAPELDEHGAEIRRALDAGRR